MVELCTTKRKHILNSWCGYRKILSPNISIYPRDKKLLRTGWSKPDRVSHRSRQCMWMDVTRDVTHLVIPAPLPLRRSSIRQLSSVTWAAMQPSDIMAPLALILQISKPPIARSDGRKHTPVVWNEDCRHYSYTTINTCRSQLPTPPVHMGTISLTLI